MRENLNYASITGKDYETADILDTYEKRLVASVLFKDGEFKAIQFKCDDWITNFDHDPNTRIDSPYWDQFLIETRSGKAYILKVSKDE